MILKGSQRGGARQLAAHLMNDRDNDHITLHELRGFVSGSLRGALDEANAISKGTRCKQFLFSLSLNPPKDRDCGIDALVEAADRAEDRLGLKGQPRAVIVHEKEGRRHAHVVWSRIDANEMKAINLPHFKYRLKSLSKDLYLDHGWGLPDGHRENGWKNPLNFTLAEWQQAKRIGLDPREVKQMFRDAWARSDNLASFGNALEEHGYYLAKGKGASVLVPNLIAFAGSVFVIDPKGENAMVTARQRGGGSLFCRGLGNTVRILDPFNIVRRDGDDFADLKVSFNPLDLVRESDAEAVDLAAGIAEALVISERASEPFWEESARALLKAVILHVVGWPDIAGEDRHLPKVRELVSSGDQGAVQKLIRLGTKEPPHGLKLLFPKGRTRAREPVNPNTGEERTGAGRELTGSRAPARDTGVSQPRSARNAPKEIAGCERTRSRTSRH